MGILKIEMPLEWWIKINEKCKELNLNPESYTEVKNYGKLYFDLQRYQFDRRRFPIPDPKNYLKI
ncbi:hypothetical protein [Fusobacterium varium]|uniref:hypothetical protein n=1 Tax=Fusobacterium varium TaxID=856 RepID=UPI00242D13A1|nr:hypothetical protein [Fusobacterium varium]MCF0170383.1 hypothetical protein [Fusobacterium varium]